MLCYVMYNWVCRGRRRFDFRRFDHEHFCVLLPALSACHVTYYFRVKKTVKMSLTKLALSKRSLVLLSQVCCRTMAHFAVRH